MSEIDKLIERLRAVESSALNMADCPGATTNWYRNPDGPEAATVITQQAAMIEDFTKIRWRSADRDNMEFTATITYSQMDRFRAAARFIRGDET